MHSFYVRISYLINAQYILRVKNHKCHYLVRQLFYFIRFFLYIFCLINLGMFTNLKDNDNYFLYFSGCQ